MAGLLLGQFLQSATTTRGDWLGAAAVAAAKRDFDPRVERILKGLVSAVTTQDVEALLQPIALDLAEMLRSSTILGRPLGWNTVPLLVRMLKVTGGASASWVGEAKPIPASSLDISGDAMQALKIGVLVVITSELAKSSRPSAPLVIAREAASAISIALDAAFLNSANTGIPDTTPAAITSGLTPIESAGSTIAAISADAEAALQVLIDARMPLTSAFWAMHPATATALAMKRSNQDQFAFPGITPKGGFFFGLPVAVTQACAASGSPGEYFYTLIEASEVNVADDVRASIDITEHACVQASDTPSDAAAPMVSL